MVVRLAKQADYPVFVELLAELVPTGPTPDFDRWRCDFLPHTVVAEDDGQLVGYAHFDRFRTTAQIQQLVVAARARRRGFGRRLLCAVAGELRVSGITKWIVNVEPDNLAAVRLYESFGMVFVGETASLRFDWSILEQLPGCRSKGLIARELEPTLDTAFEERFQLLPGQLAAGRAKQRRQVVALFEQEIPVGLAVFAPALGVAFPLRLARPTLVGALLHALRARADPSLDVAYTSVDDDPEQLRCLVDAGAKIYMRTHRYSGRAQSAGAVLA